MTNHHDDGLRGRIPLSRRNFPGRGRRTRHGAASAGMIAGCSPAPAAESDAPARAARPWPRPGLPQPPRATRARPWARCPGAGWLAREPEIADDAIASVTDATSSSAGGLRRHRRGSSRELGKKVVVVEMQPEDTFSALGNDIGHLNSSWQVDRVGIPSTRRRLHERVPDVRRRRAQPTLDLPVRQSLRRGPDWFIDGYTEQEKDEPIPLNWPVVDGYQYKKGPFTSYVGTCQFGGSVGMTDAVKRSQDKAKAAGAQFVFGQAGVRLCTTRTAPR